MAMAMIFSEEFSKTAFSNNVMKYSRSEIQ